MVSSYELIYQSSVLVNATLFNTTIYSQTIPIRCHKTVVYDSYMLVYSVFFYYASQYHSRSMLVSYPYMLISR